MPEEMALTLASAPDGLIGVAVSGGSDSLALLLLMQRWARAEGRAIQAVTVDHNLRPGSAAEAAAVAELCAMRQIPHTTCVWESWDGHGNLQASARMARRRLIARWARAGGIGAVALGHTLDDQAETFLLRLARGSGVDGLSAMQPVSRMAGLTWLRPQLTLRRDVLRAWLAEQGMCWAEDPSNRDLRFERVRLRGAQAELSQLGLTPERLADTAQRMGRAREALEQATARLATECATLRRHGDIEISREAFAAAPEELRTRLVAAALCWVGSEDYRPRFEPLIRIDRAICGGEIGRGTTLHGCVLRQRGETVIVRREPARPGRSVGIGRGGECGKRDGVWDRRWCLADSDGMHGARGLVAPGLTIAALGREGLAQLKNWRASGVAREALLSTPAIWQCDALVAAPLAGHCNGFDFRLHGLPAALACVPHLD
jgi:tRNA(Ile)-lysidine synthase